ncbi:hypothetical protein KW797_04285 [Candidatus Parcubacteria bacterium]|nr:hypothetical protein [Candidatus Parcubacteria bacterium]
MNTSRLFRLGQPDVIKGMVTAIIAGLLLAIGTVMHSVVTAPGFDIFAIDWAGLMREVINAAIIGAEGGFVGYIGKNFLSDENGAVLGRWGGVK